MLTQDQVRTLHGCTVVDSEGHKIGTGGHVYVDDRTGQPEWLTVHTGMFGTSHSFVPLSTATFEGDTLRVACTKDQVTDAPMVVPAGDLSEDDERRLYAHFGRSYDDVMPYGAGTGVTLDEGIEAARTSPGPTDTMTTGTGTVTRDAAGEAEASRARSMDTMGTGAEDVGTRSTSTRPMDSMGTGAEDMGTRDMRPMDTMGTGAQDVGTSSRDLRTTGAGTDTMGTGPTGAHVRETGMPGTGSEPMGSRPMTTDPLGTRSTEGQPDLTHDPRATGTSGDLGERLREQLGETGAARGDSTALDALVGEPRPGSETMPGTGTEADRSTPGDLTAGGTGRSDADLPRDTAPGIAPVGRAHLRRWVPDDRA